MPGRPGPMGISTGQLPNRPAEIPPDWPYVVAALADESEDLQRIF